MRRDRLILTITASIIGVLIVSTLLMFLSGTCPPQGPWPMPPWCKAGTSQDITGDASNDGGIGAPGVTFTVTVPGITPPEDDVWVWSDDFPKTKMTRVNATSWRVKMMIPPFRELHYSYVRNNIGFEGSEEYSSSENETTWSRQRTVRFDPPASTYRNDVVSKWRWLEKTPITAELDYDYRKFAPRVNNLEFQKGVAVIDYWWMVFFENGETEDTVKKIKDDNANYVQYSPTWTYESTDSTVKVNYDCSYCYPESAIRYEVSEAKKQGLKVIFRNQVWQENEANAEGKSADWWQSYYSTRREYLLTIARIAEENGVEAISIGADYDSLVKIGLSNAPQDSVKKYAQDIDEVRKIYHGKIYYDLTPAGKFKDAYEPDYALFNPVFEKVDFIGVSWWKGVSDKKDPSKEELVTNVKNQFDAVLKPVYEKTKKPVVLIGIAFPSADGGSMNIYQYNSRAVDVWKVTDGTFNDYREQADVYNAFMSAIADSPYVIGAYSFGYWRHDQQDKGYNIRGKPAELVVKKWYGMN